MKIGRIGGIDFAVGGIAGQIAGQVAAGGGDGCLHVARRRIDIAAQIELQRDVARSQHARRSHLGDGCDASELALQRRRHRRCHGLGAGAGKAGVHRNGREIHLRQRRYRQESETPPRRPGQSQPSGAWWRPACERMARKDSYVTLPEPAATRDSASPRRVTRRARRSKNR